MAMVETIFLRKTVNLEKLAAYGFIQDADAYSYRTVLPGSGFELTVQIAGQGKISTAVTDPATGEAYTLHLAGSAVGSFVGNIREEYENALREIAEKCFEPDVFKSAQAKALISYVRERYGDEPEYLWQKFPDNAVWRRKDTKKWYGALLSTTTDKLGVLPACRAEIIDLRIQPERMNGLVDGIRYFPGWHMNKKHWYTIILDGSVSTDEIQQRIDESYRLAVK